MTTINIGKDFSDTPLGRYRTDGPASGERFREDVLAPALRADVDVVVVIDDAEGYGSSFLDEAFGGLVRCGYFTREELKARLKIECTDPDFMFYRTMIWKYIDWSQKR